MHGTLAKAVIVHRMGVPCQGLQGIYGCKCKLIWGVIGNLTIINIMLNFN